MNLEAISGIKRASQACAHIREECLKLIKPDIKLSEINHKTQEIINTLESKTTKLSNNWLFQIGNEDPATDRKLKDSDTIRFTISLIIENWKAQCSATKPLGNNNKIKDLIKINKFAVTETCSSLCPGLPLSDIDTALKLYHEDPYSVKENKNYIDLNPKSPIKQRLKVGDLLSVRCISTSPETNAIHALHEESILITANGTEILTRV